MIVQFVNITVYLIAFFAILGLFVWQVLDKRNQLRTSIALIYLCLVLAVSSRLTRMGISEEQVQVGWIHVACILLFVRKAYLFRRQRHREPILP